MNARTCLDCPTPQRPNGFKRGLCPSCYGRRYRAGTHLDAPAASRTRADVLEDWCILSGRGLDRDQAAEHLGMRRNTLDQALSRARRAGVAA